MSHERGVGETDAFLTDVQSDAASAVDARLAAMLGSASGSLNWRAVSAAEAPQRWRALREWVDWFRAEFGFDHRVVPPCWYRHPAPVSVLSALRDHWLFAYDPLNNAASASERHRALMMLEQRLREWAARTGCTAGVHRPDVVIAYPDDAADWAEHLRVDAAARSQREQAAAADEAARAGVDVDGDRHE